MKGEKSKDNKKEGKAAKDADRDCYKAGGAASGRMYGKTTKGKACVNRWRGGKV